MYQNLKNKNVSFIKKISFYLFCTILIYTFAAFLLQFSPQKMQNQGFIGSSLQAVSKKIEKKASHISSALDEQNLSLNFLANKRKLSFTEAKAFQSSGLLHLLAISGGQVVPIAFLVCYLSAKLLFLIFYKTIPPNTLMQIIFHISKLISFATALLLSALFGSSGALIRVLTLTYSTKLPFFQTQHPFFYNLIPYILSQPFKKFMLIILMAIAFGNLFQNYSFLLSALGAACAEFSIYVSFYFFKDSKIGASLASLVLTSFLTGLVLQPFSQVNLLNSCMANILAFPVVSFLITPLSLLILLLPEDFFAFQFMLNAFDQSLSLLKFISHAFSDHSLKINPFAKNNPLFSTDGLVYLNFMLILLWSFLDLYKERKTILLRYEFQK